jgi:nitroimidazol reductase NimA-like FMN-containing flavoprotein (pyridoxamine 5'-phosphate oxidase superfamily)
MLGELDGDQIEQILRGEVIGRIGCHDAGRAYVVPITYVYDGVAVYGHSTEGQKLHMMCANPFVCFEVEQIDDLANWHSVIAWGVFEELAGKDEQRSLQLLVHRLMPLLPSATAHPGAGAQDAEGHSHDRAGRTLVLYRIVLNEKSGRFENR